MRRLISLPNVATANDGIRVFRRHAARAMAEERWSVAEIFLDRILEVDSRNTEAWLMKGLLNHHCRDDESRAFDCYRKVIALGAHDLHHPHVRRAKRSLNRILRGWSAFGAVRRSA